jgi:hypothetical protein
LSGLKPFRKRDFIMNFKVISVACALIFAAVFSRFLPHPANWTAVMAVSLFASFAISTSLIAILVPILALFISDLILGFHSTMWGVYLPMVAMVFIGKAIHLNQARISNTKIAGLSLFGSTLFFLISNFAVWFDGMLYPKTLEGLVSSYVMALPFFTNQLVGDLFFTTVIFSVYFGLSKLSFFSAAVNPSASREELR